MSSFKPIDGSKEDFRKYLDRKGVLDAITKVLIKCNSDRPENAIEYLMDNMGERLKDKDTIARLENDLNDARNEIEMLKREMNALKVNNVPTSTEPGNAAAPSDDSPPPAAKAVDPAGQQQQDGSHESSTTEATNPSSKVNADKETTKNVDSSETVAAAKTPENAESEPKESAGQ